MQRRGRHRRIEGRRQRQHFQPVTAQVGVHEVHSRVALEGAPADRQQHWVGVDGHDLRIWQAVEHPPAEGAGSAAQVEHPGCVAGEHLQRSDDRGEALLTVGDVQLLLRVPAPQPFQPLLGHRRTTLLSNP